MKLLTRKVVSIEYKGETSKYKTTNGGSIVADNSKKITVINQNTDGLTVEQLTGVRLEESTFKKIARQNLHMV
jgi:hypothetical protein